MSRHKNRSSSDTVKKTALICGAVYAMSGIIVRVCSGSPYNTVHILGADAYLPAIWIFNLFSVFWFFICGVAVGSIFGKMLCGRINGRAEMLVYKGCLFFISLFFLSLMWYPLFFSGIRLALSFLIMFLCVICSAFCALLWRSVSLFSSITMGANSLWLFYILLVNLLIIFQN